MDVAVGFLRKANDVECPQLLDALPNRLGFVQPKRRTDVPRRANDGIDQRGCQAVGSGHVKIPRLAGLHRHSASVIVRDPSSTRARYCPICGAAASGVGRLEATSALAR